MNGKRQYPVQVVNGNQLIKWFAGPEGGSNSIRPNKLEIYLWNAVGTSLLSELRWPLSFAR